MKKTLAAAAIIVAGGAAYFGATPSKIDTLQEIQTAQQEYYAKEGKYLQIIKGNKLSPRIPGTVADVLGKDVAENIRIDEYQGPRGDGYQVIIYGDTTITSVGYGPEAEHRTWVREKPPEPVATSTISDKLLRWFAPTVYAASESSNTHFTSTADTANRYWSIADASQTGLDFSTTATWCAYIYNTDANMRNQNWISKGDPGDYAYNVGFADGSPYHYQAMTLTDGSTFVIGTLAQSLSQNTWYDICAVYTGASTQIEIFINGSSVGTLLAAASLYNGTAPFEIAGQFGDGLWDGNIDNVRVYSTALSSSDISSNYSSPCNVSTTGLVSQWFFNNDGLDSVGSNHLTNNNSATFGTTPLPYTCAAAPAASPPPAWWPVVW